MRPDVSSHTWIELQERPPPLTSKGRRFWCFFLVNGREVLGHYLGDGQVRLLHHNRNAQPELGLEPTDKWRPLSSLDDAHA